MSKQKDRVPVEPEASEANAAGRAEADATTTEPGAAVTATYGDVTYTLDTDGDGWPLSASLAFSKLLNTPDGPMADIKALEPLSEFLAALLGPGQWAAFSKGARTRDLRGLYEVVLTALFGLPAGEASAS